MVARQPSAESEPQIGPGSGVQAVSANHTYPRRLSSSHCGIDTVLSRFSAL